MMEEQRKRYIEEIVDYSTYNLVLIDQTAKTNLIKGYSLPVIIDLEAKTITIGSYNNVEEMKKNLKNPDKYIACYLEINRDSGEFVITDSRDSGMQKEIQNPEDPYDIVEDPSNPLELKKVLAAEIKRKIGNLNE